MGLASLDHAITEAVDVAGLRVSAFPEARVHRGRWPTDFWHDRTVTSIIRCRRLVVFSIVVGSGWGCEPVTHGHRIADLRLAGAVGSGAGAVVVVEVSGSRSSLSDLSRAHIIALEQQRGDDVGESKGNGNDAGANDDLRDLRRHAVRSVGAAVETAEQMTADEDHDSTKPGEPSIRAEHRPSCGNEFLAPAPEADFGENEKAGKEEDESMDDIGEELEAVRQFGVDEHKHRRCHDS